MNLENLNKEFDCGTVACIAGHAHLIRLAEEDVPEEFYGIADSARDWLGLSQKESLALFTPPDVINYAKVRRARAVRVLKHLKKTGQVDWTIK